MSKKKHERLYDIVAEERVTKQKSSDPLEEAIEAEDRELAREAKRKRLEEVILTREAKIKELKSKLEKPKKQTGSEGALTTGALVTNLIRGGVDPKVANEWLKSLSPEAIGALIALQSNNPALAMLAFGMNAQKKGEGLTVKDVVELNKAMQSSGVQPNIKIDVAELIKAAREVGKPAESVSPTEIVDATLKAIQTGMQLAGGGEEKEQSWFDKLMSTPEGIKTAKEIGLFGGNPDYLRLQKEIREADRKFMREMKESDRRWQMQLQKMRDESKRLWLEAQERKRRTDLAAGALKRIGRAIARGITEAEEEEEVEAKPTRRRKGKSKVRSYECECGATISVPPNVKEGDTVECASCGAIYEVSK